MTQHAVNMLCIEIKAILNNGSPFFALLLHYKKLLAISVLKQEFWDSSWMNSRDTSCPRVSSDAVRGKIPSRVKSEPNWRVERS